MECAGSTRDDDFREATWDSIVAPLTVQSLTIFNGAKFSRGSLCRIEQCGTFMTPAPCPAKIAVVKPK
jgi:hypothetical protein